MEGLGNMHNGGNGMPAGVSMPRKRPAMWFNGEDDCVYFGTRQSITDEVLVVSCDVAVSPDVDANIYDIISLTDTRINARNFRLYFESGFFKVFFSSDGVNSQILSIQSPFDACVHHVTVIKEGASCTITVDDRQQTGLVYPTLSNFIALPMYVGAVQANIYLSPS